MSVGLSFFLVGKDYVYVCADEVVEEVVVWAYDIVAAEVERDAQPFGLGYVADMLD